MGGTGFSLKLWLGAFALFWVTPMIAHADLETTTTLPKGVFSPKFMYGAYSGLGEKYNSSGLIEGVADQYHLNLTGHSLAKMNPQLKGFVDSLNSLSPSEHLGDSLSMGTLNFVSRPDINYFVPTLSFGVTDTLSVGVGIPIVHFHNSMQVTASGNAAAISSYVHGISPQLDAATSQLVAAASNMAGAINTSLSGKGYKPIRDEDFTAPGDLQLSAVYRYYSDRHWRLALRPFIQVPTGRSDDPDDLCDTATGGQPAVGVYSIHELQVHRKVILISSVGYQLNIPDTIDMRVPDSPDDVLPSVDRKENLQRTTGNSLFLEGGVSFIPVHELEIRGVYDYTTKDPDSYNGSRGWNYGYLSQDTGAQVHQIKALVEFSTVNLYTRKSFSFPMIVGYVYGNTIYALNAPNEISNQLYLRMFF